VLNPGEKVIRDRDRAGELGIDMLELLPSAVRFGPQTLVLLLERVALPLQPLVLVKAPSGRQLRDAGPYRPSGAYRAAA